MTMVGDTWYRYEDVCYEGGSVQVELRAYRVARETPKGAWLEQWPGGSLRFALRECKKRFACATREQALESFVARKRRQIKIYEARASRARRALSMALEELCVS